MTGKYFNNKSNITMNQKLYNGLTKLKLSHKKAYRVSNNKYYIDNNIEKIIHFLDKRCDSDYFFKQYLSWIKFNKENQKRNRSIDW